MKFFNKGTTYKRGAWGFAEMCQRIAQLLKISESDINLIKIEGPTTSVFLNDGRMITFNTPRKAS